MVPSIVDPVPLYCDTNGAIAQANEPQSHQRSKHVLIRYQMIKEIINIRDVVIEKVPSDHNIVDLLTKPIPKKKFDSHVLAYDIRYEGITLHNIKEIMM